MLQKIKKQIKKILFQTTGMVLHLKIGVKCNHQWYGNDYGGFYVCPDLIDENSIVYSFGIGEDISFDETLIKKHACNVFGFDPTPKSINWVSNHIILPNFHFEGYGLDAKTGSVDFYLPKNDAHVSGSVINQSNVSELKKVSVEMRSIVDIATTLNHAQIDILKMDIEGSEYEVIDSILDANLIINQILVEFHERFFENGKEKTKEFIEKMSLKGFEIFAVSDSFEEISFINKNALQG